MDKPIRVIFTVLIEMSADEWGEPRYLRVPLRHDGTAGPMSTSPDGLPGRPKTRTIDLREGDFVLYQGKLERVERIAADRETWLTEAQAAEWTGDGYLYRPVRSG